ncbi:fibrinogen alpha chain [Colossoma macropomum]|uniref:fibrinogen alpha chain n=1 Tax=Colossoma macropomum TaxID=42526 RepID=UPI0018651B57|nr:fibrinogen alpha chain [Colossoma macropomum]
MCCVWGQSVVHREKAKMKLQHSLFYLCVVVSTALSQEETPQVLNPRGARPIEHGYKTEKCASEKEWPFCTDDDWGRKCPSGCRIQGLLDKTDLGFLKKIEKIQKLLEDGRRMHRSADQVSKDTYTYLRERLLSSAGNDNRYVDLAEQLRQRIVEMKIKIDRQLRVLEALKSQVKNQVIAMQRLEVDIDIKLRSCKGSCASYAEFSVDKESYVALDKQMERLDTVRVQSVETVSSLRVMKSRPMKDVVLPSVYKAGVPGAERAEQRKPLFTDVGQLKLSLEAEGSTAESAATVSKVPTGTGPVAPSTSHVTCTKTVRKVVTHTKDGVQEKYETVSTGPGCETLQTLGISDRQLFTSAKEGKDLTGDSFAVKVSDGDSKSITTFSRGEADLGGFGGDFFKDLGTGTQDRKFSSSSSSSSSFSSSKTILTGGSKGFTSKSILSTFSPLDFGDDLGAFIRGDVEDDVPDIQARSVKPRDERKSGYVGGDCVDILQNHATGGQSGLFKLKPAGLDEVVEVYCDQVTGLGGWVLVQQREDGSVNFNRTWEEYRVGFGKVDRQGRGEFWIGNHVLHLLTQTECLLRVELQDWEGKEAYAEYSIKVGPEAEGFRLSVSSYTGDAGDALVQGHSNMGSFLSHAGMKFSTFDRDNDKWEENCAEMYGGGWWYNNCQSANLNGIYYKGGQYDPGSKVPYEIENGIVWLPFKPADYSLQVVRMMIRPL